MALPALAIPELVAATAAFLDDVPQTPSLEANVSTALAIVTKHVGNATVPADIATRAVVLVAAEQFWQQDAPSGVRAVMDSEGGAVPIRVSRDPMSAARALLRPFVGLGIA